MLLGTLAACLLGKKQIYLTKLNKTNLSEQTKFRLSVIIGIENYFHQ